MKEEKLFIFLSYLENLRCITPNEQTSIVTDPASEGCQCPDLPSIDHATIASSIDIQQIKYKLCEKAKFLKHLHFLNFIF